MSRWLSIAKRSAVTLALVLCVAAVIPLGAQQASATAPPAGVSVVGASPPSTAAGSNGVQASSATTSQAGPRLRPEWRSVELSLANSNASPLMPPSDNHTIVISTLVLVLIVVIVVLLVVK